MSRHRTWRTRTAGLAVSGCLALIATVGAPPAGRPGQVEDQAAFLAKVAERVASYPDYKSWQAAVVTRQTEMDKTWRPQTVTVVTKRVRSADGVYEEEISQALETRKGKTKDVTAAVREEARKEAERERRRHADATRPRGGGRRTLSFTLKELLPFSAAQRDRYDFTFLAEGAPGRPGAVAIEARLKDAFRSKDTDAPPGGAGANAGSGREAGRRRLFNWEGTFVFDAATHDLLGLVARPAGKVRFVKRMELSADFVLLEGGQLVPLRVKTSVDAGFFLKHVRMEIEEEYADYKILD
jgi:hypothetical protein